MIKFLKKQHLLAYLLTCYLFILPLEKFRFFAYGITLLLFIFISFDYKCFFSFYKKEIKFITLWVLSPLVFFVVQLYWCFDQGSFLELKYPLMLGVNCFIGILFYYSIKINYSYWDKHIDKIIILNVIIQCVLLIFTFESGEGYRQQILFQNSPHLGLWALMFLIILNERIIRIKYWLHYLIVFILILLISLSGSRAALISLILYVPVWLWFINKKISIISTISMITLVLFSPWREFLRTIHIYTGGEFIFIKKIANIGNAGHYESLGKRGGERIINNLSSNLFGAGEGYYDRFSDKLALDGFAIHITWGNWIFTAGLLAFIIMLLFHYEFFKKISFKAIMTMFIIHLYGLMHNVFYTPYYWIFLPLLLLIGVKYDREIKAKN